MRYISALFVDIDFGPYGKVRANPVHSNPCKILTLGTEIKKLTSATFLSNHYQSRIRKKIFLEGISQLSIIVRPTNNS